MGNDLSFDAFGYVLVLVSNIATALYLATIAKFGKGSPLNSFGLMWCNGIVCIPILLTATSFTGELQSAMNFSLLKHLPFQAVMTCSCSLAFVLNYSIFLNTK